MFIYFLLVAIPLGIGLTRPLQPARRYPGLWAYFVALVLVCGLRFEVGPDWEAYQEIYGWASELSVSEVLELSEVGYLLLNVVSAWLGTGFAGVVLVGSAIFLYGCFAYARTTVNPWLAIAVITPYLVLVIAMSGIRQACAIGIGFLMLAQWPRSSVFRKLLLIAIAATFHNSAVVLVLFVVMEIKASLWVRLTLCSLPAVFLVYAMESSVAMERYRTVYIEENLVSEGAFFHLLLTAFPAALYLRYEKTLQKYGLTNGNVRLASILALIAIPLLAVSSTGVDRVSLYLSFVQMWTYAALLSSRAMNPAMLRLGAAVLVLLIFFVYFLFGSHAFAYLPYRNLLFV